MPYNSQLRHLQEWFRRRIVRDGFIWRILMGAKQTTARWHGRRHRQNWDRAATRFETLIDHHARRTPDFFFIQIGAHNGDMDDPIHRWAVQHRWRGILVEPQPGPFAQLKAGYAELGDRLVFENIAIDRAERTRPLYRVDPRWASTPEQTGLASFFPDRALATYAALNRLVSEPVQCLPFPRLLARHRVTKIDLLQIDTEGFDFEIIKMLDFAQCPPAIIHFEHRHLSRTEYAACLRLLSAHGYWHIEKEFDVASFQTALFPP
ncbi:MAG: FkbM family methyltransferase [Undibacterium sp.]|nr:FkbM family methyltransferase [Opitutaceae bacterium]